jgi:hypothetical protein
VEIKESYPCQRTPDGAHPCRSLSLVSTEHEGLDASPQTAGFRFTAAVQRSRCARRTVNAGLLALSVLRDETRRRLLDEWIHSGAGTSSLFATEADALLDVIARQLPDPSPELSLCRLEQLALRANDKASSFKPPDRARLGPQRIVGRAPHAGVVLFPGEPDLILSGLLRQKPAPAASVDLTALLVAPGLQPLCRVASDHERGLWDRLSVPTAASVLVRDGFSREVIEAMLQIGALEYA